MTKEEITEVSLALGNLTMLAFRVNDSERFRSFASYHGHTNFFQVEVYDVYEATNFRTDADGKYIPRRPLFSAQTFVGADHNPWRADLAEMARCLECYLEMDLSALGPSSLEASDGKAPE